MDNEKTIRYIPICGGVVSLPYREVISMRVGGIANFAPKSYDTPMMRKSVGKQITGYVNDDLFHSMGDDEFRKYAATLS